MNDINYLINNGINASDIISNLGIDTFKEVMGMFLDEINEKVNKLRDSLISGNLQDYATYVHGIKGEANYLGFKKLTELAYSHQLKSQEGDIEYIKNNYLILLNEIARVINVSKVYLGRE